jgi:SAM-dependent methyltransferase
MKFFLGYDNRGYVFERNNSIIRKIHNGYENKIKKIYYLYLKNNFKKLGFVKTIFYYKRKELIHQKHIISYPYEWSSNMFKDAVLFHLNLYLKLDKFGLTLKDGILNNILFHYSKPIFVDFFSLVFKKDLILEEWLIKNKNKKYYDLRFAIYDSMILPFMIEPFIFFAKKQNQFVRKYLFHQYVNVFQPDNIFYKINKIFWKKFYLLKNIFLDFNNNIILLKKYIRINSKNNFNFFLKKIAYLIMKTDVSLKESSYSSYYHDKKENFKFIFNSSWGEKQKNIYNIFKNYQPKSVLDLGCNTGWFSFLAEKNGASVIAIDNDEACVDKIYLNTKKNNLKILPLVMSFEDLDKQKYGIPIKENDRSQILFLPPLVRFQSDMVMCLALSHHLILGAGLPIKKVFENLSVLTKKYLIFEFVDLKDPLIKKGKNFFQKLDDYNQSNYSLNIVNKIALKSFKTFKIFNSNSVSRKILLYKK